MEIFRFGLCKMSIVFWQLLAFQAICRNYLTLNFSNLYSLTGSTTPIVYLWDLHCLCHCVAIQRIKIGTIQRHFEKSVILLKFDSCKCLPRVPSWSFPWEKGMQTAKTQNRITETIFECNQARANLTEWKP